MLRLIIGSAGAGLLIALIAIVFFPDLVQQNSASPQTPSVTSSEPATGNTATSRPNTAGDWSGPVSYADAVDKAAPAVVNIYTSKKVQERRHPLSNDPFFRRFFGGFMPPKERVESSLGSGVIVNESGYLLTNNHVIAGADAIVAALKDGREAVARVVGTDPDSDLAVLKIDLPELPVIQITSAENLQVGDVVLAIGNPFGVGQTVTMGIISATGRNQLGLTTFEDFLQTDAAINPGNSGGALVNAYGELVGINTAIFSRTKTGFAQGIGFAIPSDLAQGILQDIIEHGSVIRGWIGVETRTVSGRLAEQLSQAGIQGMEITGLYRLGPAHKAGLKPGDILIGIEGKPILSAREGMLRIIQIKPGQQLMLDLLRDGKQIQINVEVGTRPQQT